MKSIITFFFLLGTFSLFDQTFDWTQQTSGTTSSLRDVFFIDNQTGWAVGTNGTIIHTSDGSDTWTPQTSGVTNEVKAVHFINNTTGWASGGPIPTFLLKTTDGGANWTALTPPSTFGSGQDVFFCR